MVILLLFAGSLLLMLSRVWLPNGARVSGKTLYEASLTWRERVLLQRTNLHAFGVILALLAFTQAIPLIAELIAIGFAYGILTVPTRYRLTSDGIALNNVVFRRWDEFDRSDEGSRSIVLRGKGVRAFNIGILAGRREPVTRIIASRINAQSPRVRKKAIASNGIA